ncbi:hypothetical protein [Chromobacterium sp. IIBBL 290-4]|uniref:hypothetical protein n=1 Tax=Chromobacterium sp. IIBBL 290-4 TaxID=2953890 RepID=UPI0020B89908|nr:hypothetical protein [Chromobacterium sp. IIBBL 290-4]UTH73285.1 hypothetical protein NKT35_17350 [Chromobacterium sp. IIBBL 290-4]
MAILTGRNLIQPLLLCIALLASGHAPAANLTAAAATPSHPAKVPGDYVVTPFGYFHPSCVQEISAGEKLLPLGKIQAANGSVRAGARCAHARYSLSGQKIGPQDRQAAGKTPSASTQDDGVSGWVADSELITSSAYGGINASWIVPAAPSSNDGQVVYFFPGLQDHNNVQSILQPVLGWNAFGDSAWTIASWNCCQDGTVNHSSPQTVNSGDQIVGTVQNNCKAGTKTCGSWNINTRDATLNVESPLNQTGNYGQTFNWAFGGVLEVYGVASCQDYPADGAMSFNNVQLFDVNKRQITQPSGLGWQANVLQQVGCNVNATANPTATAISY